MRYLYVICCKQKTAYEMRISDGSSDVCSSDLFAQAGVAGRSNVAGTDPCQLPLARHSQMPRSHQLALPGRLLIPGRVHCLTERSRARSEEHTSELQSLMRISYAVFCLKKKKKQ